MVDRAIIEETNFTEKNECDAKSLALEITNWYEKDSNLMDFELMASQV